MTWKKRHRYTVICLFGDWYCRAPWQSKNNINTWVHEFIEITLNKLIPECCGMVKLPTRIICNVCGFDCGIWIKVVDEWTRWNIPHALASLNTGMYHTNRYGKVNFYTKERVWKFVIDALK